MDRPDAHAAAIDWDWGDGLGAIWRGRYTVLLAVLVSGLLTAAIVLVLPRTYHAIVALRVGKAMDKLLVDPHTVALAVNSSSMGWRLRQAGFTDRTPEELALAVQANVDTQMVGPNIVPGAIVTIAASDKTADGARRLAMGVARIFLDDHQRRFDAAVNRLEAYRAQLQAQVDAVRSEIADVEAALKTFRTNPTVGAPAVLLMRAQLEEKQTQLISFMRELRDLDLNLTINSERSVVLGDPLVPRSLIRPRRTLTTLAGASSGGILAVLWVVARDARRRRGAAPPAGSR